jgi:spoIIIJ-associated protein
VEWVEVTGSTVAEATERALEQLGVAEFDAEVQVVDEPKTGLFGRVKVEARVRARVKPMEPRPKRNRGGRSRSRSGRGERGSERGSERGGERRPRAEAGESKGGGQGGRRRSGDKPKADRPAGGSRASGPRADDATKEETMAEGVTLEEQAGVAKEFLEGLVSTMGLEATVEIRTLDEDTVELAMDGEGLGMLVGPKGSTLAAIQDVTRTVVQGKFPTKTDRILVDIARYRERRAAALTRFTAEVAAEVTEAGDERALEPMSPADRKVVHDAANDIEGVVTRSEGEEPARYVVIAPAS